MKDQPRPVVIDGDTVRRPAGPWTATVHALLDHLERAGFTGSPHAVSADGEDVVTYIPGESVSPHAWSDEGVFQVGRLLRGLHDATASFVPPAGATWHPWPFTSDAPDAIVSHRDTGPWNIVARDGLPVAFIDWVTAGPADRLEEIAATAWLNAQLHDDDVAERQDLPSARARAAQLRLFADGYQLAAADRQRLTTAMIEYAIRDSAAEAIQAGVTPHSTDAGALWAITWRARSAAWMVRQRRLLEKPWLEREDTADATATVRRLLVAYTETLDVLDRLPAMPMATRWHCWSRPGAPIRLPRASWMLSLADASAARFGRLEN